LEQFGFLNDKLIHEVISTTQEEVHSIKSKQYPATVIKLDLSKACDNLLWLYLRVPLLQVGFGLTLVKWIMGCITTTSFAILVNGLGSKFFKSSFGRNQGCPLSPYLFLLVAEGLDRAILEERRHNKYWGLRIGRTQQLTHLLFVDGVILFCFFSDYECEQYKEVLALFCFETRIEVNINKSAIYFYEIEEQVRSRITDTFSFPAFDLNEGFEYMGYYLKPNKYGDANWR